MEFNLSLNFNYYFKIFLIFFLVFALSSGCSKDNDNSTSPTIPVDDDIDYPFEITIDGVGEKGIFDSSLEFDSSESKIWMMYSQVKPSVMWPTQNTKVVLTRLASSTDQGLTWVDSGKIINDVLDVTTILSPPLDAGTWVQEVPEVVYDSYETNNNKKWKLLTHNYLTINGDRRFEHGWITLKESAAPLGLETATAIKLIVGSGYDSTNDTQNNAATGSPIGGAPLIQFHQIHTQLNTCVAITEPALLSASDALYLSALCAETTTEAKIVLLKCNRPCDVQDQNSWTYVNTLLDQDDAAAQGYKMFSAPELYKVGSDVYLQASPTSDSPVLDAYNGCLIFKFSNLSNGNLISKTQPFKEIKFDSANFNGACGYHPEATKSGFIYGQVYFSEERMFRLFSTGETL